jgi:uncharacterized membrane protein
MAASGWTLRSTEESTRGLTKSDDAITGCDGFKVMESRLLKAIINPATILTWRMEVYLARAVHRFSSLRRVHSHVDDRSND